MSTQHLLMTYRTDLIEVVAALVFLVVFKVILVWGMSKVSKFVQDDDTHDRSDNKPTQAIPHSFKLFRWILALLLLINGLVQALPTMVGVSGEQLQSQYTGWLQHDNLGLGAAHVWASHSIALNIWSVLIQLGFGSALLIFSQSWVVKIVSGLTGVFSLFVWIVLENFGNFGAVNAGILTGVPGAALVLAALSGLAFLPMSMWSSARFKRVVDYMIASYWAIALLTEWLPEDQWWQASGYQQVKAVPPIHSSLAGMRHGFIQDMAANPVLWTVLIGCFAITLGLGSLYSSPGVAWIWLIVTILWLAVLWIPSLHSGAGALYVYPFGAGLVVVALAVLRVISKREASSQPASN